MFHTVPSASTLGWAEKGAPAMSLRHSTKPPASSVPGSKASADPPSQSAMWRPAWTSTEVLAAFMSSGRRVSAGSGGIEPKAGSMRRPASVSRRRLGVSRMRARWVTPSPSKRNAWIMPSPSNQWP